MAKRKKRSRRPAAANAPTLDETLTQMGKIYSADPNKAVRGQAFIKLLHTYLGGQLERRLSDEAKDRGVRIVYEPTIFSSTKPKNVDVVVLDPTNGPLVIVGVRSQMSSVGNNVLTYYEGIVGECISLQDRFPMAVHGYVYLHPLKPIKAGKEEQKIDHTRYARMYDAITDRDRAFYKNQRGIFDVFAYMIVEFERKPPALRDDILDGAGIDKDLKLDSFVEAIISRFKKRELFIELFT